MLETYKNKKIVAVFVSITLILSITTTVALLKNTNNTTHADLNVEIPEGLHEGYYQYINNVRERYKDNELSKTEAVSQISEALATAERHETPPWLWQSPPTSVIEQGSMVDAYDYTVFIGSEGDYYARSGDNGEIIFSGSSASTVVQNAVDSLSEGTVFCKNFSKPSGLNIPSGVSVASRNNGRYHPGKTQIVGDIVGIEWNVTDDTWTQIDKYGNEIHLQPSDFNSISPWGDMTRVNLSENGEINAWYGDDGYAEDGSNGLVMVRIPKFFVKSRTLTRGGDKIVQRWISSYNAAGFEVFPLFNQRTSNRPAEAAYVGAYEACAYSDDGGTTWYLDSQSGVQPVTGTGDYTGLNGNTLSHFDIEEARTYANNIGNNWGLQNIWSLWAVQLLFNVEYGSMDSQSELGRGIVDKDSGTGFNGENTGADSINSQLNSALTGTGTGSDGYTPVVYRGIENPWGNVWTFVDGYEAVDAEYRILDPSGDWSNAGPAAWTSSDYIPSETAPLTDGDGDSNGYISNIHTEQLLKYGYLSSATAGSSSEYVPDYFYIHDSGESNILLSGGSWCLGALAGVGCLRSAFGVGYSSRGAGARLEFIK